MIIIICKFWQVQHTLETIIEIRLYQFPQNLWIGQKLKVTKPENQIHMLSICITIKKRRKEKNSLFSLKYKLWGRSQTRNEFGIGEEGGDCLVSSWAANMQFSCEQYTQPVVEYMH